MAIIVIRMGMAVDSGGSGVEERVVPPRGKEGEVEMGHGGEAGGEKEGVADVAAEGEGGPGEAFQ